MVHNTQARPSNQSASGYLLAWLASNQTCVEFVDVCLQRNRVRNCTAAASIQLDTHDQNDHRRRCPSTIVPGATRDISPIPAWDSSALDSSVLDFSSALGTPVPVRSVRSVLIGYGNARLNAEIAGHVFSAIIKTSSAGRKDDRGEQQAAGGGIRSPKSQLPGRSFPVSRIRPAGRTTGNRSLADASAVLFKPSNSGRDCRRHSVACFASSPM